MNKRGQFFLLAAVVIVAVLFGLTTIYTAVETPIEDTSVYDLTKEIKYEAGVVIDSGIFNALSQEQREKNVENLTDHYASINVGTDVIIIYGNQTEMTALFYTTEDTGSVGIDVGTTTPVTYSADVRKYKTSFEIPSGDQEVTIILDRDESEEIRYTFNLQPGEMFFLILKKERQGEQFVSASKESGA